MKPSEAIALDSQQRGLDPNQIMKVTHEIIKRGGFVLHQSNTTLVLEKLEPNVYAAHLFTHDQPLAMGRIFIQFFRNLESRGVKRLYGQADNSQIVTMLKQLGQRIGVQVGPSDRSGFNWMIKL